MESAQENPMCQQCSHTPAAASGAAAPMQSTERHRERWLRVSPVPGSHLDGLVRSTVEIVLGSHQRSHPVVETCQLLLQLELSTHNIPHLWKAGTHHTHGEESQWGWAGQGQQCPPLPKALTAPVGILVPALLPDGNCLIPLTCRPNPVNC